MIAPNIICQISVRMLSYQEDEYEYQRSKQSIPSSDEQFPPSQDYSILPGRAQHCLMLPFPFCGLGCSSFISRTTRFHFDSRARLVTLSTYPGYLGCLGKQHLISYDEIDAIQVRHIPTLYNLPEYHVLLNTSYQDIQLTPGKLEDQAFEIASRLKEVMLSCGIKVRQRQHFNHCTHFYD